jgi:diadenosine tetraphosphate (Ap4A) HIT family hydrolase
MTTPFTIDPRLLENTRFITDLPLSSLFIQNDTRFPWFVLVPRIAGAIELYQLSLHDQTQLMAEITEVSRYLKDVHAVHKVNVGALGNIVPQLHIHVVGRDVGDAAWPGPVWGDGTAEQYSDDGLLQAEIDRFSLYCQARPRN